MAKRSLQASPEGAKLARKIFDRRGWTQEGLATELDLRTRQPIWRFFTCRPIERYIFIELCSILDLNWWEIADNPPEPLIPRSEEQNQSSSIDQLICQVRSKHLARIEHQCRFIRVPGTSFPVPMESLFVDPQLLSQLASQEHLDVAELERHYAQVCNRSPIFRFAESLIAASDVLTHHLHIRISGKLGSGKTTLLKWIALQCQQGSLHPDLIPVFIKLGHYVERGSSVNEFTLLHCIQQELRSSGISDAQTAETLAREGKLLLLIDELDEILFDFRNPITREISKFLDHFYRTRAIVVSRLAQESEFPQFTHFELADLSNQQIETLVRNWFNAFNPPSDHRAEALIQQLKAPENRRIYELAQVPLFLSRICQIFQVRGPLFEVRERIYEECFALLVKEWSESKGTGDVEDQARISADLLHYLGQIGMSMMASKGVFFERSTLEYVNPVLKEQRLPASSYLHDNLLGTPSLTQRNVLLSDSTLRYGLLLEQAKGVYSFAHLAMEEYLVAWQIATSSELKQAISELISHLTEPRWREVFLLVCAMLPDQMLLLQPIQEQVQSLIVQQPILTHLMDQVEQRGHQSLLWQQIVETYISFLHLAYTPKQLDRLAGVISFLNITAQHLLLNIVLEGLQLWYLLPTTHSVEVDTMLNALLDQALLLTTSLGYHPILEVLSELKQMLHPTQDLSVQDLSVEKWQDLIRVAVAEWSILAQQEPFNFDQACCLTTDLYVLQLFAECVQKTVDSTHLLRLQTQFSHPVSGVNFTMANQFNQRLPLENFDLLLAHDFHYHWLNWLLLHPSLPTAPVLDRVYQKPNAWIEFHPDKAAFSF